MITFRHVEIITHCYAVLLPHFAAAMAYQLSSLVLRKPSCRVTVTVCAATEDELTWGVIQRFAFRYFQGHGNLYLKSILLSAAELGRRCIGRNMAALRSEADVVWFADADYVWDKGCLDRLAAMEWPEGAVMVYPEQVMVHCNHAAGDAALDRDPLQLLDFDPALFVAKKYGRAIGGVQIVQGDFARRYGYLNGDAYWQRPSARPFADFLDDTAYRRFCRRRGQIVAVDLPGVYRLRHSKTSYQ